MKLMYSWLGAFALGFTLDVAFFVWVLWAFFGVFLARDTVLPGPDVLTPAAAEKRRPAK